MKKIVLLIVTAVALVFSGTAQDLSDLQNDMLNSSKRNFGKFNILGGVNAGGIQFTDASGTDLNTGILNMYSVYIGGSYYDLMAEKEHSYWATDLNFIMGKQFINCEPSADPNAEDLSVFNFTKYSGYHLRMPLKIIYNRDMGKTAHWGLFFGGHINVPMLYGSIENNGLSDDFDNINRGLYYLFDYGWLLGGEIGFRAGYLSLEYTKGMANMSDFEDGSEIRDRGNISLTVGYRFETAQGKKDAELINNLKN